MSVFSGPSLSAFMFVLAVGLSVHGQEPDQPKQFKPLQPRTRKQLNQREALKFYAQGLIAQREDRLIEAVRNFERAIELDPSAGPVHKALIPLYFALERVDEGMTACQKVLQINPGDYETWYVQARQLKAQDRLKQACVSLERGLQCRGLKRHPEIQQQMYFELGVLSEKLQQLDAARLAFTGAAKILENPRLLLDAGPFNPDEIKARAAELYERIGRLATRTRKYEAAITAFKKAQKLSPGKERRLNFHLAQVYQAQGQHKQALRCVDVYLDLQPQGLDAYELKITLLGKLKREREIVPELQKYVRKDKYNSGLKLLLARQYRTRQQPEQAEEIYLSLADNAPTIEVYRGLFQLYQNWPRMGAEKILQTLDETLKKAGQKENNAVKAEAAGKARAMLVVLRDDASLVKPLLVVGQRYLLKGRTLAFETRHYLAVLAGRHKQSAESELFYRDCLPSVTFQNEQAIYTGLLKILWQRRKYDAIVQICQKGLKQTRATNHLLFHLDLARALPFLEKMDDAIAHANQAVNLATSDETKLFTRLRRVSAYTLAEKFDKAIAECRELLKSHKQPPDLHDIRYTLSGVYTAARMNAKAEEELARLIKDFPDDPTPYNDLGYLWADQNKNLNLAEEYIRKAMKLDRQQKKKGIIVTTDADQDNAAYIDSFGWVLFRKGQLTEARRELERALTFPDGEEDPVVWDHLGDVYYRLEQPARARHCWLQAVKRYEVEKRRRKDGRYKEIKDKLKLLETSKR